MVNNFNALAQKDLLYSSSSLSSFNGILSAAKQLVNKNPIRLSAKLKALLSQVPLTAKDENKNRQIR